MNAKKGNYAIWLVCAVCFISSINSQYLGSAMTAIRETFGLDYTSGGTIVSVTSVVSMATPFVTGMLLDRLGPKPMFMAGAAICIAGMIMAAAAPTMGMLVLGRAIGGFGGNAVYVTNTNVMGRVADDPRKGYTMMHSSFGVGGVMTPIIVLAALTWSPIGWRTMPIISTVGLAILMLFYLKMNIPPAPPIKAEDGSVVSSPFKNIRLYILTGLIMFYMAVESTITSWMVSYLQGSGIVAPWVSQYFMTIYWGLMIVGRMIGLRLVKRMTTEMMLLITSAGMLIFYGLFVMSESSLMLAISVVLLGLFMAPIYPMCTANVRESVGMTGKVSSVMSVGESTICALTPPLVGLIGDMASLRTGMSFVVVMAVITLTLAVWNHVRASHHQVKA